MSKLLTQFVNSDVFILDVINNSIKCRVLDWFLPKVTYLGSIQFAICLCLLLFMYPNKYVHQFSVELIISLILCTLLTWVIKLIFNRPRPFLKIENLHVKKISIDDYSFPSAHSASAFAMAVTASIFFPEIGIPLTVLATFVGISRIYIGVHYPTDVLIGTLIGTVSAMITYNFIFAPLLNLFQ
ncbi:MAG: phosphatase PAP2 family protein [Bacillota bacterium]|nr:phosphatase PAP2 family protein [Bacillota bacterium]